MNSFKTCVVVPDVDFPNFSQVVICFQVKLVQAATLKSSVPLQVATSALIHTIQTDANMSSRACERRESNLHLFLQHFHLLFSFLFALPTCSSPAASLDQNPVVVKPRAATETQLPQPYAVQVVQLMSDEPHHQVNQQQGSTHNRHNHVTHRTVWLQLKDRRDKITHCY